MEARQPNLYKDKKLQKKFNILRVKLTAKRITLYKFFKKASNDSYSFNRSLSNNKTIQHKTF